MGNYHLPAVHHVPVGNSLSLFFSFIPHAGEDDKGRLTNCLEYSEHGPNNNQTGEVAGRSMAGWKTKWLA